MKLSNSMFLAKIIGSAAVVAAVALTGSAKAEDAAIAVDPKLPDYVKVEGVSGNLNSIGSDTLNNLMAFWSEGFRKQYPNVTIGVEGKGSSTAPPALIAGSAQLGPMSRPMKKTEVVEFEGTYGYKPTAVSVALDSLAVFVHKDNPVQALSLQQIDSMFSKTYKRKGKNATTWGDVGVTDPAWAGNPVSLYGRNSASGTNGFFKEHVLAKGDYKDTVKEQPGSSSVVMGITEDKNGAGYSGIGFMTSGVKAVAVLGEDGKAYAANYENVKSGKYPIWRPLLIYVAKKPGKPLDPVTREFLRFVLSKQGQEICVKDGFYPLSAEQAEKMRKLVE